MRVINRVGDPQPGEHAYRWTITDPRDDPDPEPDPTVYEWTRTGAYQALKWWMTIYAEESWESYYKRTTQPPRRRRFRRRKAEKEQEAHHRQARARARQQVADLINTNTSDRISIEIPPGPFADQPQGTLQGQIHADPEPPTRQKVN